MQAYEPQAYGPARPEEQAALRRPDVDLVRVGVWIRTAAPELCTGRRAPGDTKSAAGKRFIALSAFVEPELRLHLELFAEKEPDGLLFVGEKGAPFRRSSFGRKWRKARGKVGLPTNFRFYDLRHTGHTISTRSGATLKGTMVRAGQSSEKAALRYQHSNDDRQREVADGIDAYVQARRARTDGNRAAPPLGTRRERKPRRAPETNKTQVADLGLRRGAGDGNRTRALSLGSSCSTIKLRPRGADEGWLFARHCTAWEARAAYGLGFFAVIHNAAGALSEVWQGS